MSLSGRSLTLCNLFGYAQACLDILMPKIAERRNDVQKSASSRSMSAGVASISETEPNGKKGMVLPFQPLSITFDDIRYSVDMPQVS